MLCVHRAARLNQTVSGEGNGWTQFVTDYFPVGRNSEDDAKLLWVDWRVGLVKEETPYGGIALSSDPGNSECGGFELKISSS